MADTSLIFNIFAKDHTRGTLSKIGRNMGGAFAGIGTAAVAAGAFVAVEFGQQSVQAFIDAEAQAAKFDDAFSRFPELTKYKGEIEGLAEALALKTKYDDDATKSAAATLAKFDLTGEQLKILIPLTQDYASATGKDLGSSSKIVGKALLGNVRALKDLGVAYKPTGDKAKDFAAITAILRDKVGGFAEKEGKTAAGTAAILANQFGEVQEQIGSYLVPALVSVGQWIISTVIPAIAKLVDWFQANLAPVIADVGKWIMGTFVPAVQELAASFMKDVWPAIQAVAAQIANNLQPVIASLADFWTNTLLPAIVEYGPAIKTVIGFIGGFIAAMLIVQSKIVSVVIPAILGLIGWLVKMNTKVRDVVIGIKDGFTGVVDFVRGLPGRITSAASGMWNGIASSFRSTLNSIIAMWNNLSFSLPSVDIPGLGRIGGMSLDTPNLPMLASGGTALRGGAAIVGERGPEIIAMPRGASVIPLQGNAGGIHIDAVYVQSAPGERTEESIPRAFRRTAFVLGMGAA